MTREETLIGEQNAFDRQIQERIDHGHIPDLRCGERNDWFYNNVWRDPALVKLSFLEDISFLNGYLESGSKVLEVGCGPGHNSLELARNGHRVTGIDLSPKCIEVAEKTLAANAYHQGFGSLDYICGDFLAMVIPGAPFDAFFFYGVLSHFPDIESTLERVCCLLKPGGKILIYDTSVDVYSKTDAALLYALKSLLTATGHYFESRALPENEEELGLGIERNLAELRYVDDVGNNVQSPNDNSQTGKTMLPALAKRFDEIAFSPDSCFYRNMVGGLRFEKPEDGHKIASFIKLLDGYLTRSGILNTAYFYYVGRKK